MSDPLDHRDGAEGAAPPSAPAVHRPDLIVAGVIFAVCAALYANTFWFDSVPSSLAQNVQPTTFPRLVLIVIVAITCFLPFEYHRKRARGIDLDEERSGGVHWIVPATGLLLVLLVGAMPTLGAYPALLLICGVMPVAWGERRWLVLLIYVLIFPLAVLFLFSEILQVTFPGGIFGRLFV